MTGNSPLFVEFCVKVNICHVLRYFYVLSRANYCFLIYLEIYVSFNVDYSEMFMKKKDSCLHEIGIMIEGQKYIFATYD